MNKKFFTLIFIFYLDNILATRSIHRAQDPGIGSISVRFEDSSDTYYLRDHRLREFPLFKTYNHDYLMKRILPNEDISYRYEKEKSVHAEKLEEIINKLLKDIESGKKKFNDFKILKQRDFNWFSKCGLLVLKFKDYPFIFKLFIENPKSFVRPFAKSFQVRGVFVLGGTFRHIVGYTRIRNLDLIKEKIENHPEWSKKIVLPRKWFWIPKNNRWLIIKGHNLGCKKEQEIRLPAIYGVLCDEIKENAKRDEEIKRDYLKFCSFLEYTLDALPSNFKASDDGKIVLIDTEHFATLIGINKKFKTYDKYSSYWPKIIGKYMRDGFVTSKTERREKQRNSDNLFPLY